MDTRHLVESPLAAAPAAAAETLGTPVPAILGTRRDFCVAACQALSLGAIAATLQACGGSNPNEPSDEFSGVPQLPAINATVTNGVATVNVGGTALANNGGTAIVIELARHDARRPQRHHDRVGVHRDLHPSAVHGHRLHRRRLPVPVPRIALQHRRPGRPRSGDANLRRFNATIANDVISITA